MRGRQQRGNVAVADAVEFQIGAGGVYRNDRNATAGRARQNETVAGKADHRGAVGNVDVEIDIGFQRLLDGRRKSRAQGDLITLPVGQTLDADFAALGFESLGRGAVQENERRVIDTGLDQRLGNWTQTRGVALSESILVFGHAKTLARAQVRVIGPDGFRLHQRQAGLVGAECGPKILGIFQRRGENFQCLCPCLVVRDN